MTNHEFTKMSEGTRLKKLRASICEKANGALTAEEIRRLLLCVKLNRQYHIRIYTDPRAFCEAIVLWRTNTRHDTGRIAFGRMLFGEKNGVRKRHGELFCEARSAAAIVTQTSTEAGAPEYLNLIHIYIPHEKCCVGGVRK